MSAPNALATRVQNRRRELRALMREVRWLRRAVVILALLEIAGVAAVVWRLHWEYVGG